MKLLLDENLSRRLVPALQARFPGSSQVALLGLQQATDAQICEYAAQHDFVVCSKDDDFQRLVAARGYRPRLRASVDRQLGLAIGPGKAGLPGCWADLGRQEIAMASRLQKWEMVCLRRVPTGRCWKSRR